MNESERNDAKEFSRADKALAQEHDSILTANASTTLETSGIIMQSHPQAYRTSRLIDFTQRLNEILDQSEKEIFDYDQN